jgi:hypothetical protein
MPCILCRTCRAPFDADPATRGAWQCPNCHAKNPNLRRHYRGIGNLCILALVVLAISAALGGFSLELSVGLVLIGVEALLLLLANVMFFKLKTAWPSATARRLIWALFVSAFLLSVGVPLSGGLICIPAIAVYAIVFPYLFWLHLQTKSAIASSMPMNGMVASRAAENAIEQREP